MVYVSFFLCFIVVVLLVSLAMPLAFESSGTQRDTLEFDDP